MDREFTNESLHKEIDLIQSCIARMARNSFMLKGWYISLLAIVISILVGKKIQIQYVGIFVFILTLVFWGLDAFFLKTETLYRWKYEWVIRERLNQNFDYLYDLNPYNKQMWLDINNKDSCLVKYMFSKTLIPLYFIPWLISLGILVYKIFSLQ